jgi:ABC-2 type transport system permease protein
MRRYIRIYKMLLRLNLANTIAYRANFINSIIGNLVWTLFGIVSMLLLTTKATNVYGWTRDELLILVACYHIVMSVFYVLFARNFQQFADTMYFGKLDSILMRPIDPQFLLSVQHFGYTGLIRFFTGIFFLTYLFWQLQIQLSFVTLFTFIGLLILSVVILYSIWYSVVTITIWHGKLTNLVDLLYALNSLLRNPGDVYRGASLVLYILLFPFMVIITSPVKAMLQDITPWDLYVPILIAAVMIVFCRLFWKFALRHYTSASS